MPGIFAPEQSVDTGGGGTVGPTDSPLAVGGAYAARGLNNLFGMLEDPATPDKPTAKRETSEVIKPLLEQVKRIQQSDDPRGTVRIKVALRNFIVSNSGYQTEAVEAVNNMTGLDFGDPVSPEEAIDAGFQTFINSPEGMLAVLEGTTRDADGVVDPIATQANILRKWHEQAGLEAKAASLKREAEMMGNVENIAKSSAAIHLPAFTASQHARADEAAQSLIQDWALNKGPDAVKDANTMAGNLRQTIREYRTAFMKEALMFGYEGLSEYDVEVALQPLTNLLATITSSTNYMDDIVKLSETLGARDSLKLGEAFNSVSKIGIGGHNRSIQEAWASSLAVNELLNIDKLATASAQNSELMKGVDSMIELNLNPVPTGMEEGEGTTYEYEDPFKPQTMETLKNKTPEERKTVAQNGFFKFKMAKNPKMAETEAQREAAAVGLTEALGAIRAEGVITTNDTLTRVFDDQFWSAYDNMVKAEDRFSGPVQHAVGMFFVNEQGARLARLDRELKEGRKFEAIHLGYDPNTNQVRLNVGIGFKDSMAEGDKEIRLQLKKFGLPLSTVGLEILVNSMKNRDNLQVQGTSLSVVPTVWNLNDITQGGETTLFGQMSSMNKLLALTKKDPTLSAVIRDKIVASRDAREVIIYTDKDFENLQEGTRYVLMDKETGKVIDRDVK